MVTKELCVAPISTEVWQQIKAGYAAGIGLREIARKMNLPEGTVLARAKRERWTQQIEAAKQAAALTQSNAYEGSILFTCYFIGKGNRNQTDSRGVSLSCAVSQQKVVEP